MNKYVGKAQRVSPSTRGASERLSANDAPLGHRRTRGLFLCFGGPVLKIRAASGRDFTFEMHSYLGPMRVRTDGEPTRYPFPDNSKFWDVFELWQAHGSRVDAFGRCEIAPRVSERVGGGSQESQP